MPISESPLDAMTGPLVRIALAHYTGNLGGLRGVMLADGVALSGCPLVVAERLRGIFGPALTIVGPWDDAPVAPVAIEPPALPKPPPRKR